LDRLFVLLIGVKLFLSYQKWMGKPKEKWTFTPKEG
jgi:hypothetical protein